MSSIDVEYGAIRPSKHICDVEEGRNEEENVDEEEHVDEEENVDEEAEAVEPNPMIEEEEEHEEGYEDVMARKGKIRRMVDPMLPSQAEIDMHMLTHLPYRNWCEHCVRGRGKQMDHKKAEERRDTIEFHLDFCFPGGEEDEQTLTILVMRERSTRMTMASAVPSKSTGSFIAKRGVAFMKEVGCEFGTVILKSDQEPAMKAIIQEMCRHRAAGGGTQMTRSVVESSPVGSSASNGVVERAIQSVEAQMRVMRSALESRCGVKIPAASSLWAWMAEYAAVMLNRMEVGRDGKTAYERTKGKPAKHYGFEFGERVLWRRKPVAGALGKLSCLWDNGIFLGVKSMTGEFIVGDQKGVWKTRSMHRKPVEQRWDAAAIAEVSGVPWRISEDDKEVDGERLPTVTRVMQDEDVRRVKETMGEEEVPRSFAITKEDLAKHGYTDGCAGCKAVLRGVARQGHTPACRRRMEGAMAGEEKVKSAVEKEKRFIERAMKMEEQRRQDEDEEGKVGKRRKVEAHQESRQAVAEGRNTVQYGGATSSDGTADVRGQKRRQIKEDAEAEKKGRTEVKTGEKREHGEDSGEGGEDNRERKRFAVGTVRTLKEIYEACPTPHEDEMEKTDLEDWDDYENKTDSVTGKMLSSKLVEAARREEIEFIEAIPVYDMVDESEAWERTGKGPVSGKWVDVNKGKDRSPEIRSRWVARDFKPRGERDREDLFADMPPLEAKRMLFRMAKVDEWKDGRKRNLKALIIDVRKAHLNAVCDEEVYVQVPPESELAQPGKCGRLRRWLYGMRPAAQGWQNEYSKKLVGEGFVIGRASKVVFYHESWGVRGVVHGDDFTFVGEKAELIKVKQLMQKWYDVKVRGLMGEDPGDDHEMTLLNRELTWGRDRVTYEADPRHVEKILEALGIEEGSNTVVSPIIREPKDDMDDGDGDNDLDPDESTLFRSVGARCNYLAQDRHDIAYAVKCICQDMSAPKVRSMRKLKRLARYLLGVPKLTIRFEQIEEAKFIDVYTDSDWAGDRTTRKSTSGGILCVGGGVLKSWSKSQSVIAKSSGEAEFCALNRGLVEALGLRSIAKDMGYDFNIRVHVDSSAAKAMVSRTGLGKTRHIQVENVWSQDVMRERFVSVKKIAGVINHADICTKPMSIAEIRRLAKIVNVDVISEKELPTNN